MCTRHCTPITLKLLSTSTPRVCSATHTIITVPVGGRTFTSKQQLSPTISIFTASGDLSPLKAGRPSLANYEPANRPLAILLCWLMAKNNAIQKYSAFYLDQGFDVLTVQITPGQLLWPGRCRPVIEAQLLPILESSGHGQKIIHGFSVGGYIFGQLLKHLTQEPEKYRQLATSMKAQIWDSVVDVNGVAVGVSKAVFLHSPLPQRLLESYINLHMAAFYSVATKYYDESHHYFYNHPLTAPALFLCSKVDPISTMDKIQAVQLGWGRAGITCTNKVWNNSKHVGHMLRYPEEYKESIRAFLGGVIGGRRTTTSTRPDLAAVEEREDEEDGSRGRLGQKGLVLPNTL